MAGIQMWVTLVLWFYISLWRGSFCIDSDEVVINNNQANSSDTLVSANCTCVRYYFCNDPHGERIYSDIACYYFLDKCCKNFTVEVDRSSKHPEILRNAPGLPTIESSTTAQPQRFRRGQSSFIYSGIKSKADSIYNDDQDKMK